MCLLLTYSTINDGHESAVAQRVQISDELVTLSETIVGATAKDIAGFNIQFPKVP
jgi:hypothetical protein